MLNFHELVLRKFIFIFSILFLIISAIVYYWIKDFYIEQTKKSLLNNIEILSFELQRDSNKDLLAQKIKQRLGLRLSIISEDGLVLAESHKDKKSMDNHKQREEILQANKQEYGYILRHSLSINKDLLYVAKVYQIHEKKVYIRLAKELTSINEEIASLGVKILFVLGAFFLVVFFVAYNTSKKIENETKSIASFLHALTKKKKTMYIHSDFSLEFNNITNLLTKVSQVLLKREKQKSKYTAKLKLANKQKDDIISAISHEFKNPIAVINGYAQTLLEDDNIDTKTLHKFLLKIHKNTEKLNQLIDTLRLSIQLDKEIDKLQLIQINLYDSLQESIENLKISYPNREVIIQGNQNFSIKADYTLFNVILSNLIENAFKYSQNTVHINFDENSLNIIDTGIGISEKNLENITQKFYRVHENSWNNSLGLGLYIVNTITKLHGFKLEIQSIQNKGSSFSIRFT